MSKATDLLNELKIDERKTPLNFFTNNARALVKDVEDLEMAKKDIDKWKKEVSKDASDERAKQKLSIARDDAETAAKVIASSIEDLSKGARAGIDLDPILQRTK